MKPNIGDKIIRLDIQPDVFGNPIEFIWDEEQERRLIEGNITLDNVRVIV